MLFKSAILQRVRAGEITRAFRRWRKPTVKAGGTLRTEIGVLAIERIDVIEESALTERDAKLSGFAALAELRKDLAAQREGTLYRIDFTLAGADPRIALRENARISADEMQSIAARLAKLDAGKAGPWTRKVLKQIASNPGVKAGVLAEKLGLEKEKLKVDIRKLKELGLTESLLPGYRISPRGKRFLKGE